MNKNVDIIIVEDNEGHALLVKRNLVRAGIDNKIINFKDGQQVLDFLFRKNPDKFREKGKGYLILLDIRMPKVDGIKVLNIIKLNKYLKVIPVIMLTTTGEPEEIKNCYNLGCNGYIKKPVDYDEFINAIKQLGLYMKITEIPKLSN